jgi:hypothetical protein
MLTVYKYVDAYYSWGLIWFKNFLNNRGLWGHTGGWTYGTRTAMFFYPKENWGIITFLNLYPSGQAFVDIIRFISDYASLYGEIYAINTNANKTYLRPSKDTLIVRTEFSNIDEHQFTAQMIVTTSDSSYSDSTALYDDGLHEDDLPDDGIWGGFIHSISMEEIFSVGISTLDSETNDYYYTEDLTRFTTAGPVELDSITWSYNSIFNYYSINSFIRNNGNKFTISNPLVNIVSNDPWITYISGASNSPSLPPGGTTHTNFIVRVDSTFPGQFNFKVRIGADGWYYWVDSTTIVTKVDDEIVIPISYRLEQNFPNPFNPKTIIKYQIPKFSFVTLKVYDVLGSEVTKLVNEEKPIGSYTVDFNARALSSGIYFYRLQAGSFVETKKMILIK